MLTIGFAVALAPWTIRNARVFGVFQPIAPQGANMPGEFVPSGYIGWLRTWVDDVKYTESLEFPLDVGQLHIEKAPDYAFDSPEEREQVAALLERYNHPASAEAQQTQPQPVPAPDPKSKDSTSGSKEQSPSSSGNPDEEAPEEVESSDPRAELPNGVPAAGQSGWPPTGKRCCSGRPGKSSETEPHRRTLAAIQIAWEHYPIIGLANINS